MLRQHYLNTDAKIIVSIERNNIWSKTLRCSKYIFYTQYETLLQCIQRKMFSPF